MIKTLNVVQLLREKEEEKKQPIQINIEVNFGHLVKNHLIL